MRALWSKELDKNGFIYGPGVPLHRVILSSLWLAASSEVCSESRELVPRLSEVTCLSLHLSRVLHAKLPKQCSLILTLQFFLSSRRFFLPGIFFFSFARELCFVCCVETCTLCSCWDRVRPYFSMPHYPSELSKHKARMHIFFFGLLSDLSLSTLSKENKKASFLE